MPAEFCMRVPGEEKDEAVNIGQFLEVLMAKFNLQPQNFFKIFLFDQGSFCGATDCPYFGIFCDPPRGFQSQGSSLTCTLTCYLLARGEPKDHMWCYICLFHQQGCKP